MLVECYYRSMRSRQAGLGEFDSAGCVETTPSQYVKLFRSCTAREEQVVIRKQPGITIIERLNSINILMHYDEIVGTQEELDETAEALSNAISMT